MTRRALLTAAGTSFAGFLVVALLVVTKWGPWHSFDISLDDRLNAWVAPSRSLTDFWKAVTTALEPATWEVIGGVTAIVVWWRRKRARLALFLLVTIFGTVGLYDLVKVVVGRSRPVVPHQLVSPTGASFPSGHAMMSAVAVSLAVIVTVILTGGWPRPGIARGLFVVAAAVVAALVAFSRLALGAHYLSDVVGGWLLAATWVLVTCAAFDIGREFTAEPKRR